MFFPPTARRRLRRPRVLQFETLESLAVMTSVTELQGFVLSHQLPNGAVHPGVGDYVNGQPIYRVDPYFADIAVQGLLRSSAATQPVLDFSAAWLTWRLGITKADGTIDRTWHNADGSIARGPDPSDGDDSAAAMTPVTAWDFRQFGGSETLFHQPGVKEKFELIASVIVNLQQSDGLTWGSPTYLVKYVADNAEVFSGFVAMANIEREIYHDFVAADFYTDRALSVQAGILNTLYDDAAGYFGISVGTNGDVREPNWNSWYDNDGAWSVVWPTLFGVIPGDSVIADVQQDRLNLEFDAVGGDRWQQRFDFGGNGLAALIAGDRASALEHYEVVGQSPFPNPSRYPAQLANISDAGLLLRSADPFARDDRASVAAGSVVDIHVTANDVDMFTVADDLVITTPPRAAHGNLTVLPAGRVRYQPDSGYSGADSFQYTAQNSQGESSTATVWINPPPPLQARVLPDVEPGVVVSQRVAVYDFSDPYFNFRITQGALPPGMSLSPEGRVEGASFTPGLYVFTVTATNTDLVSESFTTSIRVLPPPTVIAASFLPTGKLVHGQTTLSVSFSEPVVGAGLVNNYQLTAGGRDGVLGTGDDIAIAISAISGNGTTATLSFAGLASGAYRLTVSDAIHDLAGNSLDGDANGAAGSNWVGEFTVDPITQVVTSLALNTTGVTFSLSQPAVIGALNLVDYRDSANQWVLGDADVRLVNSLGATIPGSLSVGSDRSTFTFAATGGALPADTYTLILRSADNGFHTSAGQWLDGDDDGVAGGNYVTTLVVAPPAANAISLSIPSFARGPSQPVQVPATSSLGLPINVDNGEGLTDVHFELYFDPGLFNITGISLPVGAPGGSAATVTPMGSGHVVVSLFFSVARAAGAQSVGYLQAAVPASAANRYGERAMLDIAGPTALRFPAVAVAVRDVDALQANAYFGDVSRDGVYNSFDVQQVSRAAVGLDTGYQQHLLLDPRLISDFDGVAGINSFDVQRLSRLAVGLSVDEAPPLPVPPVTVSSTGNWTVDESPSKPSIPPLDLPPSAAPQHNASPGLRSDVDNDGVVDAQDILWAVYLYNDSPAEASAASAFAARPLFADINGDNQLDPADILLAITDFNFRPTADGESVAMPSAPAYSSESADSPAAPDDLDSLLYLLATDAESRRKTT